MFNNIYTIPSYETQGLGSVLAKLNQEVMGKGPHIYTIEGRCSHNVLEDMSSLISDMLAIRQMLKKCFYFKSLYSWRDVPFRYYPESCPIL